MFHSCSTDLQDEAPKAPSGWLPHESLAMDPISILNFQASEIVRRNLAWMHALRSQCYLLGDERGEPGEPRTPPRARSWDEHEKMYSPKGPGPSQDHSQEGLSPPRPSSGGPWTLWVDVQEVLHVGCLHLTNFTPTFNHGPSCRGVLCGDPGW